MRAMKFCPFAAALALAGAIFDETGELDRDSFLVEVKGGRRAVVTTLPPLGKK